ncbi:MAG: hypothetical protein II371_03785 [Flavobacteriales bacterium]|nr:hypothetical protein [Flavobacteriales bacterium]
MRYYLTIDEFKEKLFTLPLNKAHDLCANQITQMMSYAPAFSTEDRIRFFHIIFDYFDYYNQKRDNVLNKIDLNQHIRILHLSKYVIAKADVPADLTNYKILLRKHISAYNKQLRDI